VLIPDLKRSPGQTGNMTGGGVVLMQTVALKMFTQQKIQL
jgi:hypothetical protein